MIVLPMLVIGIGAGLPCGLMDGLSVSVVPVERAGMATGIFSTVRVAGEGVALAIVSAALADLISTSLGQLVPLASSVLQEAGQRLAVGDLAGAAAVSANQQAGLLREAYQTAFSTLCWWLAASPFSAPSRSSSSCPEGWSPMSVRLSRKHRCRDNV